MKYVKHARYFVCFTVVKETPPLYDIYDVLIVLSGCAETGMLLLFRLVKY